ncbi:hypothetical protein [Undibacterium pigrum]|nr:hypothetical protein [Undibacterium pigrum]
MHELRCYYHANLLVWSKAAFSSLIEDSVSRLHFYTNKDVDVLILFLEEVCKDKQHPFLDMMHDETWIDWREDQYWSCFQAHLNGIIFQLKDMSQSNAG